MICKAPDKRGIEDNSKIIFLINKNICHGPSFERLGETVLMMGSNIRFKGVICKIIPKLSL